MAKLIYSAFTSLDGYVEDETGNFNWAELDEEVHAFINRRERRIGTYLLGRKMYETMAVWESRAGVQADLAGGRKDRVLDDAAHGLYGQDTALAEIRTGGCA